MDWRALVKGLSPKLAKLRKRQFFSKIKYILFFFNFNFFLIDISRIFFLCFRDFRVFCFVFSLHFLDFFLFFIFYFLDFFIYLVFFIIKGTT